MLSLIGLLRAGKINEANAGRFDYIYVGIPISLYVAEQPYPERTIFRNTTAES